MKPLVKPSAYEAAMRLLATALSWRACGDLWLRLTRTSVCVELDLVIPAGLSSSMVAELQTHWQCKSGGDQSDPNHQRGLRSVAWEESQQ